MALGEDAISQATDRHPGNIAALLTAPTFLCQYFSRIRLDVANELRQRIKDAASAQVWPFFILFQPEHTHGKVHTPTFKVNRIPAKSDGLRLLMAPYLHF
jgi:hypothetical protein